MRRLSAARLATPCLKAAARWAASEPPRRAAQDWRTLYKAASAPAATLVMVMAARGVAVGSQGRALERLERAGPWTSRSDPARARQEQRHPAHPPRADGRGGGTHGWSLREAA